MVVLKPFVKLWAQVSLGSVAGLLPELLFVCPSEPIKPSIVIASDKVSLGIALTFHSFILQLLINYHT